MPRQKSGAKSTPSKTSSPSEIAPGVFVGNWEDALRFRGARFCVLDEAPDDMPRATHIRIYHESGDRAEPSALDRLADAVGAAVAGGEPALIFCHQGRYRSPLAAAWYLHRSERIPLEQATKRVVAARPKAKDPSTWVGNYAELAVA